MTGAFAYLDEDSLNAVRAAAIDLGFATDAGLDALAAGISPAFASASMTGGYALARLYTFTERMNTTRVLRSGEVPLRKWLTAAVMLAAGRPGEEVLRTALGRISADHAVPERDVADLPRLRGELEIEIGEDDTLSVAFLHDGSAASRSVAQVLVHRHFDGEPSFLTGDAPDYGQGTGWLIADRLLITNHHVVQARLPLEMPATDADFARQGRSVSIAFDLYGPGATGVTTQSVSCAASDRELDFALLRLTEDAPARPPLRLRTRPILRAASRPLGARVNVLQHPAGKPMRLGFRNNFVVTGTAARLSYLTDTAGGASGSPICDDSWFVAGLHRGYTEIPEGRVIVWGRPISQENYGTPITTIMTYLAGHHPDLHAEIAADQARS